MKAIPVIGVPVLNRGDMLLRLYNSIDSQVDLFHIINNGNDRGVVEAIEFIVANKKSNISEIRVSKPEMNLGVAASWNFIIRSTPAEYWLICGNDIYFESGQLQIVSESMEKDKDAGLVVCGIHGYSCYCITPLALERIGYFDENIYPAYLEDCDYNYRHKLAGIYLGKINVAVHHGDGVHTSSMTINSSEKFRQANRQTHWNNGEYYVRKWGGANHKEIFTHPFNDPTKPITYWELDVDFRRKQQEIWATAYS